MELTIYITVKNFPIILSNLGASFSYSQLYLLEVHSVFTNKLCTVCTICGVTWLSAPQASNHRGHPILKLLNKNTSHLVTILVFGSVI
jgi:hypothetical protein